MMCAEAEKEKALTPIRRWHSDSMALWGVCDRAACRRARACRGEPLDCYTRYAWLLPEQAFEGACALLDGKLAGELFDDVYDEAPEDVEALIEWCEAVRRANPPRGQETEKAGR